MMLQADKNPWLGLASYEYNDAYRFFGREEELSELKTAICNNLFTTIYGISGAGKTSLINAGMMPLLEKEGYLPIRVRLDHKSKIGYNSQIIKAIISTLENSGGEVETENVIDQENISEKERLWNFLFTSKFWSKSNHQVTPVIFIDQFEEIFTNNDSEETIRDFFEVINSLQYNNPPANTSSYLTEYEKYIDFNDVAQLRIVLIMREDFLARLEDYSFNIPALRKNRRGIKRMNGLQALEVIQKPMPDIVTRNVAIHMLGKVTGKIVKDSTQDLARLSVDTSILSLFCSELYQKAVFAQQSILTEELVGQFGDNIISSFYDDTMGLVSSKTVEYLESHLLTYSGFRNSVALEDLEQNGIKKAELTRLTEKRLIRIETSDGIERVEYTHDVLCQVAKQHREKRLHSKIKRGDNLNMFRFIIETSFISLALVWFLYSSYIHGLWIMSSIPHQIPSFCLCLYLLFIICKSVFIGNNKPLTNTLILSVIYFTIFICSWLGPLVNSVAWSFGQNRFVEYFAHKAYTPLVFVSLTAIVHCLYKKTKSTRIANIAIALWFVSFTILLLLQFKVLFILAVSLLFIFVFSPYYFKREKTNWITSLGYIPLSIAVTMMLFAANRGFYMHNREMAYLVLILIMIYGVVNSINFSRLKKKERIGNALLSCINLQIYKDYPFIAKYTLVLFSLFVYSMLFLIGIRLNDAYTLVLTPVLCCILIYIVCNLFIGNNQTATKDKNGENKTIPLIGGKIEIMEIKNILWIFLTIIGVLVSQYFVWHLCFMVVFWGVSLYLVYRLYSYKNNKQLKYPNKKNKAFLISTIIWGSSIFVGTIMGMGYNVFTLPQYARVMCETQGRRPVLKFISIKDYNGQRGVRDRQSIVVPVYFKSVSLVSDAEAFCFAEDYLGFPYSLEKEYSYITAGHPEIKFRIETDNKEFSIWDCSEHLDLDNICTSLYVKYYEEVLNSNPVDYGFERNEIQNYLDYLICRGEDTVQIKNVIERKIINDLTNISIRLSYRTAPSEVNLSPFRSINDVRNNCKEIYADDFYKCIKANAMLFTKTNSVNLSRLLIDTLLLSCKNYKGSTIIKHSELSKFRIYARDYKLALQDAQTAISQQDELGIVRQIESLYLQGRVDDAINLLKENRRNKIPIEKTDFYPYSEDDFNDYYKYLGDQVWQDINEFIELGILQDIDSHNFYKLRQYLIEESKTPDYDYAESMDHFRYVGVKTYWENKNIELYTKHPRYKYLKQKDHIVSPCMFSFSLPVDNAISVIIDANDTKRKFLDFSEYSPTLMENSYDHAWRFSEGLAAVSVNNKIGFINENGTFVIQPQYPYPQYDYHETYRTYGDNQIRLDKYNNIRVDFIFEQGQCRMSGNNNKFGIIDKQGNWNIPPIYDKIGELLFGYRKVKIGDKYGLIDIKGTVVIPVKYNWKEISCNEMGWTVNSIPMDKVMTK